MLELGTPGCWKVEIIPIQLKIYITNIAAVATIMKPCYSLLLWIPQVLSLRSKENEGELEY